jgi:SAM-dependent methyltransferase
MADWNAGNYERTAAEFEPVAEAVVKQAELRPGERVLDLACGTGNAALLAAGHGARVVGVDSAGRLLGVARERARALGVEVDFREGDLLELPVDDAAVDVVASVFGLIFAADPSRAVHEVARVVRPGGRVYVTAWIPAGPIDAMLAASGRVLARLTQAPPRKRFPWSDRAAVASLSGEAGLSLQRTSPAELEIRDSSPEAYLEASEDHPMALEMRPILEGAGAEAEVRAALLAVLREGNEDPSGFLVRSPYVVHELRRS